MRGDVVGKLGKTDGRYPVHLHMEIRDVRKKLNINDLGRLLYRKVQVRDVPANNRRR